MRIAQVAPLYESVPPRMYGGTERVVSYLTEELVRQGHEVTLFASGDSLTEANLVPMCPRAVRLDPNCVDQLVPHFVLMEEVFRRAHQFDIIHFHIDFLHYPLSYRSPVTQVTTLHGRLDIPELPALYRCYPEMPVISISNAQRRPLPWLNWQGNVYHGLPPDLFTFRENGGEYLAFLGRISPEKGVDRAIEIAQRSGNKLKVAAKIDKADKKYYQERIEPLLQRDGVEFLGEIGGVDKDRFLGGARALLFPIAWPEPFGLVMIESMACGTPVIAFKCGSVPEVLPDAVAGFVVANVDEAVKAIGKLDALDRRQCRAAFEARYTARRMAADYLAIYERLVARRRSTPSLSLPPEPHRVDVPLVTGQGPQPEGPVERSVEQSLVL